MKVIALSGIGLTLLVGVSPAIAQEGRIFETLPPTTVDAAYRANILKTAAGTVEDEVDGPAKAWLPLSKLWGPAAVLRVCFLNGDIETQTFVAQTAHEWNLQGANIRLDFGQLAAPRQCNEFSQAQIRVAFNDQHENSSWIGRDALVQAPGWRSASLHLDINEIRSYGGRGIVLHEFGHALGLNHEHQRPGPEGCQQQFSWPAVFDYFWENHGWSQQKTWGQVGPRDAGPAVWSNQFDPSSIMMYQFPPYVFHDGADSYCFITAATDAISQGDRDVLMAAYTDETWAIRNQLLADSAGAAVSGGNLAEARHIAVYAIEIEQLNAIAEAYDQENVQGFQPPPEAQAQTLLDTSIAGFLEQVAPR